MTTYLSGIANELRPLLPHRLPRPLRKLLGIWAEEIDAIYDEEKVAIVPGQGQ